MISKLNKQHPLAIANLVIIVARKQRATLGNLYLQKILFYLDGYYLTKYDQKLIDERFVKWQTGPVCKTVYDYFRDLGAAPIKEKAIDAYFDEAGRLQLVKYELINMSKQKQTELTNLIKQLLHIKAYQMVQLLKSDDSYQASKKQIAVYQAQPYTSREAKHCYQELIKQFNIN